MKKIVIAAALALCSCKTPGGAARPVDAIYPVAELQQDVAQIQSVLNEAHPALFRYSASGAIDSAFRALRDSARIPMTAVHFWKHAASAVAVIRDNHTTIVPSQGMFDAIYRDPGASLPLRLAIIDRRLFVSRSYMTADSIRDGSEILSVNGVRTEPFLEQCIRVVPSDGDVMTRGTRKIERDFELTCALANGLPREWILEVKDPSGPVRKVSLASRPWRMVSAARRAIAPRDTVRPASGALTFTPDSAIAVLTLRTFSKSGDFDPGRFVKVSFATLRRSRARALILDVRGNGGGRDRYAAHLYAQFASDTFTYYTRRTVRRGRYPFLRDTDDWMLNYMIWFIPKTRNPDGGYLLRMGMDKPMSPVRNAWRAPVIMLVDGNSLSTSSELASVFRARRRGLIVGEESGSALAGGTGATVTVALRNTGLSLNLPLMNAYIKPAADQMSSASRGVQPDVVVTPSLADLVANRDPVLDTALTLARRAIR